VTAVGVLGIGRMGGSMARALAAAGFEVVCWNRTSAAAEALAGELGGRAVRRPADVAAAADICVSMLADGDAVATVFRGPDGLLSGARSGNVFVDSSTVPPSTIRGLADDARAAGAGILDAPVSGSVALAEGGGLTIMVGGEEADLETARPVLDALAKTVFHMGPLGSGAAMRSPKGSSWPKRPASIERGRTTSWPRVRSVRHTSATSARRSSSPTPRRWRLRSSSLPRISGSSRRFRR
jgi:3-hydroxyisobutyrate dehydrogenase-like beta-hydroxyacid dehydrogenase